MNLKKYKINKFIKVCSLILLGILALTSCEKADDPVPDVTSSKKVSFVYNDKLIVLDSFFMNDIRKISTNEVIGKRVSAYQKSSKKPGDEYSFDFYFYTTDNTFELYGLELYVTQYFSSGAVLSITKSFNNIFANDTRLNFSHDIVNNDGKLEGEFNGKLVEHAVYDTISISQGKISFDLLQ